MVICKQCQNGFELTEKEREFLEHVSPTIVGKKFLLPEPKLCANCRRQRRYAFRNDRKLYKRKCDKTGRNIISVHHPQKPYPVYAIDVWWSDAYDPYAYGRDFDFNRPFFEQMKELSDAVPRAACVVVNSENCDYTVFTLHCRNCFLSSRLADSEDIYYAYLAWNSRNCFDGYNLNKCELCYECIDCGQCYQCFYTERSKGCFNLMFCSDMSGCSDCFGCIGLVQKKYYFFNKALSKEDYEKKVKEWWDGSVEALKCTKTAFEEHQKKYPVRATPVFNSENVNGSHIFESRNVWNSFDVVNCEDVLDCSQVEFSKDLMDCDFFYQCELCYETIASGKSMRNLFSFALVGGANDVLYSNDCNNANQNLFGCVGMKNSKYCVLNKQYSKEEYEKLAAQVVVHMQKTGEWGEFFPIEMSTMAYNESAVQERYSLTKDEVLKEGWSWYDVEESSVAQAEGENTVKCEVSGRVFRLIPQELKFYKEMGLSLPTRHPEVRHADRLSKRNPYVLRKTKCQKCAREVDTDYPTDAPVIYCHECYLKDVY